MNTLAAQYLATEFAARATRRYTSDTVTRDQEIVAIESLNADDVIRVRFTRDKVAITVFYNNQDPNRVNLPTGRSWENIFNTIDALTNW
jgi:hypothetical protein